MTLLLTVFIVLIKSSHSALWEHTTPEMIYSAWTDTKVLCSHVIPLDFEIPLFGNGTIDQLWISTYGSISYNQLISDEVRISDVGDNIVLAPYFLPSLSGTVQYERFESGSSVLEDASNDVNQLNDFASGFTATNGILVTWTGVVDPLDSSNTNTFQAFILTDYDDLAEEGNAYVVYNYEQIDYTEAESGDQADVGLFVNAEDTNSCYQFVNGTLLDRNALTSSSNVGTSGKWAMRIDNMLACKDYFATACGDEPLPGEWTNELTYFENSNRWDFFVRYECKNEFEINPNVTIQDSFCLYDPDYYDSKWSCTNPPKCQDFSVAKEFEVSLVITEINGQPIGDIYKEPGEVGYEEFVEQVEDAIAELLEAVGLDEGVITAILISKDAVELIRELNEEEVFTVEFDFTIPTTTRDTANEDDIATELSNYIEVTVTINGVSFDPLVDVKDKTKACLELCLGCKNPEGCFGQPPTVPPNKCCGTCSNANHEGGKAYSTLTHACCKDEFIFDPDTHVCCDVSSSSSSPIYSKIKGQTCDSGFGF